MKTYSTGIIEKSLIDCDDIQELKREILPLLQDQRTAWAEKIEQILTDRAYTCKQFAQLCRVSEPAVRKWRKGSIPQSRDMYLRIGFAAGYSLEEMNAFLQRYGRCPQLYVKSLEDSVCMFVLRSDRLEHTYETYLQLLDMVKREIQTPAGTPGQYYSTNPLASRFGNVTSIDEMLDFAKTSAPSFRESYTKLYNYVNVYLSINLEHEHLSEGDGRKASFNAMATESCWSSSLRHCISEIRQKRWFPVRHKVISLGLHLNMDTEAINLMLRYAQMEPLYPKNPIEAAIMWAIQEAKLASIDDAIIPDGSSDLCVYVKDILTQLDLDEEGNYLFEDL